MAKWHRLVVIAISSLTGVTSGCATFGQVVDSATGQPIEGVYAVTHWSVDVPNGVPQVACLRMDVTRSDTSGRLVVPESSGIESPSPAGERRTINLYRAGYRQLGPTESKAPNLTMERDTRVGAPRMEYLVKLTESIYCGIKEEENRPIVPVLKAMYAEMEAVAPRPTREERYMLVAAKYQIELFELDGIRAQRNLERRMKTMGLEVQ